MCQFGLARPSYVPPREFSELRQQCRFRRKVVADRARIRNRLKKTLDHDGLRAGCSRTCWGSTAAAFSTA